MFAGGNFLSLKIGGYNFSFFHFFGRALEYIPVYKYEIGILACFQAAGNVRQTHLLRSVDGICLDAFPNLQSCIVRGKYPDVESALIAACRFV